MKSLKKLFVCFLVVMMSMSTIYIPTQAASVSFEAKAYTKGKSYTIKGYKKVTSSDKGIVSVKKVSNKKYKLTARKPGTATIKLYKKSKGRESKILKVIVTDKKSFKFNTKPTKLKKGKTKKLSIKYPKGCRVVITTSNKNVIALKGKGRIKAVGGGKATVGVQIYYFDKLIKRFDKKYTVPGKAITPKPGNTDTNKVTIKSVICEVSKSSLKVGQTFSKSDIKLTGTYSDGSKKELTDFTFDFPTTTKAGTYTLKVVHSGSGKIFNYDITVKGERVATDIEVSCKKSEVNWGYNFTKDDFTVKTVYSDGSKDTAGSWSFNGEYDGDYCNITITSGNFSKTLKVKAVKAAESTKTPEPTKAPEPTKTPEPTEEKEILKSVDVELKPTWVYVGENLKEGQITMIGTFKKGEETYQRAITDFSTNFSPKSEPGKYPVEVKYQKAKCNVTVEVKAKSVKLKSFKAKAKRKIFFLDDKVTKDDLEVIGTYSDGTQRELTDYEFAYKPGTSHKSQGVIEITIKNSTLKLLVTCYDRNMFKSLRVSYKGILKVGETINRDNFDVVGTTYDNREITTKDFTLSWESKDTAGTYPLEVTAGGQSITFNVVVKDA